MTLKSDAKFEEKLTCCLGSYCPKQEMYELKIYRVVMCHDNEE